MPGSKTYPSAIVEGNGEVGICGLVGLVVQTTVAKSLTHSTWLQHISKLTILTMMLVQLQPTYVLCSTINSTFAGSINMASLNRESSVHAAAGRSSTCVSLILMVLTDALTHALRRQSCPAQCKLVMPPKASRNDTGSDALSHEAVL